MKLTNQEGWNKQKAANPLPEGWSEDPSQWPNRRPTDKEMEMLYGAICWIVAEKWADLMEKKMAEGIALKDCAHDALSEVDRGPGGGISGFQYGAIVSILSQVWEHGEELRRWHNLDIQLGHEGERANETGGVLNPALLNFGS